MWQIGDEAVCIVSEPWLDEEDGSPVTGSSPTKGSVYVVVDIIACTCGECPSPLSLVFPEWPMCKWEAEGFRKVDKRQAASREFVALLKPQKILEPA